MLIFKTYLTAARRILKRLLPQLHQILQPFNPLIIPLRECLITMLRIWIQAFSNFLLRLRYIIRLFFVSWIYIFIIGHLGVWLTVINIFYIMYILIWFDYNLFFWSIRLTLLLLYLFYSFYLMIWDFWFTLIAFNRLLSLLINLINLLSIFLFSLPTSKISRMFKFNSFLSVCIIIEIIKHLFLASQYVTLLTFFLFFLLIALFFIY